MKNCKFREQYVWFVWGVIRDFLCLYYKMYEVEGKGSGFYDYSWRGQ